MPRMFRIYLGVIVMLAVWTAQSQAVQLRGRIVHVGFPAESQGPGSSGNDHIRIGSWTPILIDLTNEDGDLFEGSIEVRQKDRDGDEIVCQRKIAVRGTTQIYLYVPAGLLDRQEDFAVHLFNSDGSLAPLHNNQNEPVTKLLPPRGLSVLENEAIVILDISAQRLAQLNLLVANNDLVRELAVARISPRNLPDNVAGLDMADIIVWDTADASAIDLRQYEALVEWVRRGGTLVLGISKNWSSFTRGRFADLLPAKLQGTASTTRVRELADSLFDYSENDNELPDLRKPLTYCPITHESLTADASVIVPRNPRKSDRLFVTSRPIGNGQVIMSAAELTDLLEQGTNNQGFLRLILGIRTKRKAQEQQYYSGTDLFTKYIVNLIGFQVTAGLYLLFAFIFVSGYTLVASLGNWTWLKRKKMIQHNWLAFAAVALAASGASLAAVQLIRGYGYRVQELSIVDGRAGSFDATATSYFGLKTASHTQMDLRVPAEWSNNDSAEIPANLKPLPPNPMNFNANTYSAGKRYESKASLGELNAVSIRATLKQFQAHWQGQMNHRLRASLLRDSDKRFLHPNSWIHNDLSTDLESCYLLVPMPSIKPNLAIRSGLISVYDIGKLADNEKISIQQLIQLATQRSKPETAQQKIVAASDAIMDEMEKTKPPEWSPRDLNYYHNRWLNKVGVGTQNFNQRRRRGEPELKVDTRDYDSALLLMTTFDDLDQDLIRQQGKNVERSMGQRLDLSRLLDGKTALFVGFSKDPGPSRLCWRKPGTATGGWKPIHPSEAHVMYRIAIPIAQ